MNRSLLNSPVFVVFLLALSLATGSSLLFAAPPSQAPLPGAKTPTRTPFRNPASRLEAPQLIVTQNITVNSDTFGPNYSHPGPWIALDALNPNHILASSIDTNYSYHGFSYVSTDGANSWTQVAPDVASGSGLVSSGDPIVAFDKTGNGYLVEWTSPASITPGVYIFKNQGITWTLPVTLALSTDTLLNYKPFVAVDHTNGAFANRIYASWTANDYNTSNTAIIMRHADASNFLSWSSPITVSPSFASLNHWTNISIGADGAVYVAYVNTASIPQSILLSKSTNGGISFTNTYTIAASNPVSRTNSFIGTWSFLPGGTISGTTVYFQVSNGPALATHPTDPNKIAAVWMEGYNNCNLSTGCSHANIVASYSINGGVSWTAPVKVNDDSDSDLRDHFLPALAAGPDGTLHASWYDRRQSVEPSNPYLYNEFYSYSQDWGQTWSPNVRVSTASSDPANPEYNSALRPYSLFLGFYSGIAVAADNSVVMPIWTDARSGEQDVLTARLIRFPLKNFLPIILR